MQVAVHAFAVGSHTGLSLGQSAPVTHPTHVSLVESQIGVAPVHAAALPGRQTTQKPSGSLHTGAPVEQFASDAHPSVHVCVVVLHTPFAPVQSALLTHCTQRFVVASHAGVEPVHTVLFVSVHWTHVPLAAQAGCSDA